ncbi:hypothetical protein McanMca71_001568 [Microsporum canis]|uniref:Ataxin-2 C-terminal domain-containing protein n=1 Tax=Arthroderma otae (strain ATCC MYA-4605 / CBS 113480) TaxID=554155 RepID=C5FF26_ARTOC|nr:uncharacterized protein MCYG_01208 [Microsporum canis CBS 113480]EEQ28320.1 predicted protein [Microsporum canis CBS 113480]
MAEIPEVDDERATRMKALQMADLGTARREHISTVDRPNKLHRMNIEQIEATRDSNRKGTEAYSLAEANRDKLNSWATYHETLDENLDSEKLEPLLDGQTHRMALEAKVKGSILEDLANSNRGKKATRGALKSGRGGGAAGARGRGAAIHSYALRSGSLGRGDMTKSDPRRLTPPSFPPETKAPIAPLPQKLSDPSKDCNNPPISRGRPERKRYGVQRNLPPVTKARRPVFAAPPNVNFESLLADGDDFMAAVSNVQIHAAGKPTELPTVPKGDEPPDKNTGTDMASVLPTPQVCPTPSPPQVVRQSPPPPAQCRVETTAPPQSGLAAAPPVVTPTPAAPLRIDVFTNPPENRDGQGTDSASIKTDHGFGSYLPQPQRTTRSEDYGADDLFLCTSPEQPFAAQIDKYGYKFEEANVGASLLDISDEPEEPEHATTQTIQSTPQTRPGFTEVKLKEELNAAKQELLKLTKLLSNQSILDPDVIIYLQERKNRLEEDLAVENAPEVGKSASQTFKPKNAQSLQAPPSLSQSVAPPTTEQKSATLNTLSDTTNGNVVDPFVLSTSQTLKREPEVSERNDLKAQENISSTFNQRVAYDIPGITISQPQATFPHGVPLIIGDHLLPGRPMKSESSWPNAESQSKQYEPNQKCPTTFTPTATFTGAYHFGNNQASAFNGPFQFTYPPAPGVTSISALPPFSAPVSAAVPDTNNEPAVIDYTVPIAPKSRFKMRDAPQFPITAATMQYYSGSLTAQQLKPHASPARKTNENINPVTNFTTSQPIEPGQKFSEHSRNSSSSLSPVASTFRPLPPGRGSIPFAFGASNSGRSTPSHHSRFSSTAPEGPREPKNVFVAEMAKRGVSVSGVPVNNAPVERKKNGMESSKYAH